MEQTPIDCENIFEGEDPDRTAVIVKQSILSDDQCIEIVASEQYGAIETTRFGHTDGKSFLAIQFKDTESARTLIAKRSIAMWNDTFTVIPFQPHDELIETIKDATFTHYPYYTSTPPQRSDENILNVLNDDCLGEVFRRMDPWERVRMENVCKRFKRVAEKAFVSVYQKNNIWLSHLNPNGNLIPENESLSVYKKNDTWWGQLNPDENLTLTKIEKFLHRYGPSINWMTLYDEDYKHMTDGLYSISKLMAEYCPNIKKLRLLMCYGNDIGDGVDTEALTEFRPLLSKLSDLVIGFRSLSICNAFIEACGEIEKLILMVSHVDSVLPEIKFPKLKSFHITDIERNGVLDGFLTLNPQIEYLKIPYVTGVIRSISDKVPNLRELNLNYSSEPLSSDDSLCLKNLKRANISIYSDYPEMVLGESRERLFQIKNITSLTLWFWNFRDSFDVNVLVELTKQLWKLEKIEFVLRSQTKFTKDLIMEMLQHANQLTMLKIIGYTGKRFREQDYNDILHIVKNRSNQIGLNIYMKKFCEQLEKHGRKTFLLNTESRWLTIISWFESTI